MEPTIEIGRTIKSFGKEGYIRVVITDRFRDDVEKSYYMLIEQEGYCIPYFIEDIDIDSGLVKFDEINGPEQTKNISDSRLFLLERDVKDSGSIKSEPQLLKNYTLIDQEENEIGKIIRVDSMPMQEMLVVLRNGRELLIPFHEDLLIDFDRQNAILQLEIIDGLLDI